MKHILLFAVLVLAGLGLQHAVAIDQAMPALPANHPPMGPVQAAPGADNAEADRIRHQDRSAFAAQVDLVTLRQLVVQHEDQLKILDSWASQSLSAIRNRQSIDGQDPLYTALDMAFRPEAWDDKNIIYVQAVPIREEIAQLASDPTERQRIITAATVSPAFLRREDVQERLQRIELNTILAPSVEKVFFGSETFAQLKQTLHILPAAPPAEHQPWLHPAELQANDPLFVAMLARSGQKPPNPPAPGFSTEQAQKILQAYGRLAAGWRENDVGVANRGISELAVLLPAVNPADYPSPFKRTLEHWYNRTFNGTLVALIYAAACTLFIVAFAAGVKKLRRPAMGFFTLAAACHVTAMLVRWYLAGRIPNQNMFESVLGAALLGCLLGWCLELWRKNNLFGMAFSFVGFLAMTACFVVPFVIGKDMGASIGRVAGILSNTYWLYIHVNVVIWSYALIAASFVLGATYLLTRLWHWISPLEPADSAVSESAAGGGGAAVATARPLTFPAPLFVLIDTLKFESPGLHTTAEIAAFRRGVLEQLDAANMVILQMAFWMLGTGIVCGAIWADVSWGRPWGWDPKETFALVTWIVYLIIVHMRYVTPRNKADWTAYLSIAGFCVMMFNWIGVNFFLAGLHSYA